MKTEFTGTYSPDDNKLRLYAGGRLDHDLFLRVKEAGFRWAPKQELFVAPMWTPGREDLLMELCGEITDEDISLVDRAEERADRFEGYQENRAKDAKSAAAAVQDITSGIPFGQPILVGHHSEKRARKDADKITRGMERAVKMWETSQYWEYRAAGAIRHAKYKEKPAVRARRIKKVEAAKRKQERYVTEAENLLKLWASIDTIEKARLVTGRTQAGYLTVTRTNADGTPNNNGGWHAYDVLRPDEDRYKTCPSMTLEQVKEGAKKAYPAQVARCQRWISHYNNRLIYEKTMLEAQGAGDLLKPKARPKQLPICNYKAVEGFVMETNIYRRGELEKRVQVEMTKAEYKEIYKDARFVSVIEGTHRMKATTANRIPGYIGKLGLTGIDLVNATHSRIFVFITDAKTHAKPEPVEPPKPDLEKKLAEVTARVEAKQEPDQDATLFNSLKESLKEGVKVAVAPQLFPTPPEIAEKMADYADLEAGLCVLEPSAGTGNLVKAVLDRVDTDVLAYEINQGLCSMLEKEFPSWKLQVRRKDFLEVEDFKGQYPRIIMNPPFEKGVDIKHINHALDMLKPGGRLVALCANGPRQRAAFMDQAEHWEDLPAGSFKTAGTNVNVALMVLTK